MRVNPQALYIYFLYSVSNFFRESPDWLSLMGIIIGSIIVALLALDLMDSLNEEQE